MRLTSLRRKRPSSRGGARDSLLVSQVWSSFPVLAENGSLPTRLATSRLPTHIPDLTALEGDHRDDIWIAVVNAGFRSSLFVPLLKDDEVVGIIALGRKQMQPFTDKQISLFRDFAAQAAIALEIIRRERQYREMQSDLAHANRVATMGQLTASIAHEIKQPIATARNNATCGAEFSRQKPTRCGGGEGGARLHCERHRSSQRRRRPDRVVSSKKRHPGRRSSTSMRRSWR